MNGVHELWVFMKDFGSMLNFLLIPIFLLAWRARGYLDGLEKRISALEWLHNIRGCHELQFKDRPED